MTSTSKGEHDHINKLLQNATRNSYWIGGKINKNGIWTWVTGEQFSYINWASGQPDYGNDYRGETVLNVYRNENPNANSWLGSWNDLNPKGTFDNEEFFGLSNFGFLCEWDSKSDAKQIQISDATVTITGNWSQKKKIRV